MAKQVNSRRQPEGKSKTDLRRGQFTPGMARPNKEAPPRGGGGTSLDEQSMLFDEDRRDDT
jgi:hypothetical protein